MLTKEDFTAAKVMVEPVEVPELKGTAHIKVMTGPEREAFESSCYDEKTKTSNVRASIVLFTLCDETGVRLFKNTDRPLVEAMPATVLEDVASAALLLNRIGGDSAIEEAAKN